VGEQPLHGCELAEGRGTFARLANREEEEGEELYGSRVGQSSRILSSFERVHTEKTSLRTLSTRFSSCAPRGRAWVVVSEVEAVGVGGARRSLSRLTVVAEQPSCQLDLETL